MTLDVDREKFRQFVTYLINTFKTMESELMALQMVQLAFRTSYHDPAAAGFFDLSLETARQSPRLQQAMHDKYDVALEQFLARISAQSAADLEQVEQWLREWKPTEPINWISW